MSRLALILVIASLAAPVAAEELSVEGIITAYRLGAPAERILQQVNDPANSVTPVLAGDLDRLRAAEVPDEVVQALLARAPMVQPTQVPARPDNPTLPELVRLVRSGLSEKIVAEQIRQGGVTARPSIGDLIYLKENEVPEAIIVALMEAPLADELAAAPAPAPLPAGPAVVRMVEPVAPVVAPTASDEMPLEGLVYRKSGIFARHRDGKLLLKGDKLIWRDASDAGENFEMYLNGVAQVTVLCQARESAPFCYRLEFDFAKGDDYAFEDAARDLGGNEGLLAVVNLLGERFPNIAVVEKVKK